MKSVQQLFQRYTDPATALGAGYATAANDPKLAVSYANSFNDVQAQNIVQLIFTADNAGGTAALSTIGLLPGSGKGRISALPTGVTLSGDYTDIADFYDYIRNNACKITNIMMQSADVDNYKGRLTVSLIQPNGTVPNPTYKNLVGYRVSTGNGYSDVIDIKDLQMVTIPKLQAKFDLKKNTAMLVYLTIESCVESAALTKISF